MIHFASRDLAHLLSIYGYWAVLLFVAIESTGIPFPGETMLLAAAIYAGTTHHLNIGFVIVAAAAGAILGDNLGFWVGREGGYRLLRRYGRYIRLDERKLKLGQYLFIRHGGKVVFFGRFVAVLRAWAAFLAGVNRMRWRRFLVFNAAGGILWATIYGLGGYVLGNNVHRLTGPVGIATVTLAVLIIIVFLFFLRRNEKRLEEEAVRALPGPLDAYHPKSRHADRRPLPKSATPPAKDAPDRTQSDHHGRGEKTPKETTMAELQAVKKETRPLLNFWNKANNDWVFNLAGIVAYNLLMSIFPILIALLGILGVVLGSFGPTVQQHLIASLQHGLPAGTASSLLPDVYHSLSQSSPYLLIAGILSSVWFGSRLFITLEGCLGIIYRVPQRTFLPQNLMAVGMLLLFIVLTPLTIAASLIPAALDRAAQGVLGGTVANILVQVGGAVVGLLFAFVLFEAILVIVPNRKVRLRDASIGALVGAVLLEIYTIAFPYYAAYGLHASNYGATAGFAIVLLIFFYYFAFILFVAAELNSYLDGERATAAAPPMIMHQVQQHRTIDQAAGPAGPHEDTAVSPGGQNTAGTPRTNNATERPPAPGARQPSNGAQVHDHHHRLAASQILTTQEFARGVPIPQAIGVGSLVVGLFVAIGAIARRSTSASAR
jgi:YihY family inner membrane protein